MKGLIRKILREETELGAIYKIIPRTTVVKDMQLNDEIFVKKAVITFKGMYDFHYSETKRVLAYFDVESLSGTIGDRLMRGPIRSRVIGVGNQVLRKLYYAKFRGVLSNAMEIAINVLERQTGNHHTYVWYPPSS